MTRLLAIETSSLACSAALLIDERVEERFALAAREHATLILPMIESLLVEAGMTAAQLDACAFGRGPGSFTGVRIAACVIQGIAFAADLPVVPVSTLAALAQGGMRESGQPNMLTALDARKAEVYWGVYQQAGDGLAALQGEERVCAPASVSMPEDQDWIGVGSGWAAYGKALGSQAGDRLVRVMHDLEPRARDVATLALADYEAGRGVAAYEAIPVYLRDKVADERKA